MADSQHPSSGHEQSDMEKGGIVMECHNAGVPSCDPLETSRFRRLRGKRCTHDLTVCPIITGVTRQETLIKERKV